MSSGLAFPECTYVTTAITLIPRILLFDSDANAIACLDIGYGVTFVDKA